MAPARRAAAAAPEAVDRVLLQIGKLGKFQVANFLVVNMPILFVAIYMIAYVFTAQDLNYRCLIPECETADAAAYAPPWLPEAIPVNDGSPEECVRFVHKNSSSDGNGTCSADLFDTTRTERCGAWVYEPGQRSTILNEWDLTCDDNKWKLALVGSIGSLGGMVGMPLAGFLSDRFGRKTLLMWSWVVASVSGIIQSFSLNFTMFLSFEFLNAFFSGGVYSTCFVLALEFVGPEQRVLITTLVGMFYSGGNAVMGALAWALRDWRWLLRAVYGGGLVFAIPLWFTPESVRWLAAVGRLEEADAVVARVAAINRVTVNETLSGVDVEAESADSKSTESAGTLKTLISVFKSRTLLLRFITCALCWLASCFVYYGLLLNTVTLSGDQYVNFALSGLVEIPSNLLSLWLQYNAGRRWSVAGTLVVAGVFCLAILGVPADIQWLVVVLYILGRFTVINSINLLYVVTAEIFPTNVRQSMLNSCMTFGRIGVVLAPQTPLLATVSESLPLTLFGVVSLSSGLLALLFPETKGRPLPETLEEAESLGADQGCFRACCPSWCKRRQSSEEHKDV